MHTDFTTHLPKKDYTATLKITGTKADFQELYKFMESSELREIRDSKVLRRSTKRTPRTYCLHGNG